MENVGSTIMQFVTSMPFFFIMLLGIILGKIFYDKTTDYKFRSQLIGSADNKTNWAFGVHLGLYMLGLAIALKGVLAWQDKSPTALMVAVVYALICIVLVRLSVKVNDLLILNKFAIHKEIVDKQCMGTALASGGSCLATGIMINGAVAGGGIVPVLVYWVIGQIVLIVGGQVFQVITSYDMHQQIGEKDNIAAGLSFCGFLTGLGIVARTSMLNASNNLIDESVVIILVSIVGLVLLVLTRFLVDQLIIPKRDLSVEIADEKNIGLGAVAASSFIGVSLLFSAAMQIIPAEEIAETVVALGL